MALRNASWIATVPEGCEVKLSRYSVYFFSRNAPARIITFNELEDQHPITLKDWLSLGTEVKYSCE